MTYDMTLISVTLISDIYKCTLKRKSNKFKFWYNRTFQLMNEVKFIQFNIYI